MSPAILSGTSGILVIKIAEYMETLTRLFPDSIKPKHHLLIHYSSVMKLVGPLWKISCMRFESKNQDGKASSKTSNNRINIDHTTAMKHQLRFSYRFLKKEENNLVEKKETIRKECLAGISVYHNFLPESLKADTHVTFIQKCYFQGENIKNKSIMIIPSENGPLFYESYKIIKLADSKVIVIAKKFEDVYLDKHTKSYEMVNDSHSWCLLHEEDLSGLKLTHMVRVTNGKIFFIQNWYML